MYRNMVSRCGWEVQVLEMPRTVATHTFVFRTSVLSECPRSEVLKNAKTPASFLDVSILLFISRKLLLIFREIFKIVKFAQLQHQPNPEVKRHSYV